MRNNKMEMKMYAVFDSVAQAFMNPMLFQNDGQAIRSLQNAVNAEGENQIAKSPADFSLFYLGKWNDKTATLETEGQPPRRVVLAFELANSDKARYNGKQIEELFEEIKSIREYVLNKQNTIHERISELKETIPELLKHQAE